MYGASLVLEVKFLNTWIFLLPVHRKITDYVPEGVDQNAVSTSGSTFDKGNSRGPESFDKFNLRMSLVLSTFLEDWGQCSNG